MKRIWFAAAALVAVLVGCILCTCAVRRRVAFMTDCLSRAELSDLSGVDAAIRYWQEEEGLLDALQLHSEIDQIGTGLERLRVYGESGNQEEFPALCAELKRQLRHIEEMELPLLQNVF